MRRVSFRERLDRSRVDAADRCDFAGIVAARALAEFLEAQRMAAHVVVVDEIVANQYVHQAERERRVGSRQQGNVRVAFLCGERAIRIDGDEPRPEPLGLLRPGPKMHARGDGVAPPENDEFRLVGQLHIDADPRAQGNFMARRARRRTDRTIQQARAQPVKEALGHRFALHQAHRSCVTVRLDLLWVMRRNRAEVPRDGRDGFIPADPLEAPFPLLAYAAQRMKQSIGVIGSLGVARHFRAEHAGRRSVVGRSGHFEGDTVLDMHVERAGVGTIVRTSAFDDRDRRGQRYGGAFRLHTHHAA